MRRAYFMPADKLEVYFEAWEEKWLKNKKDINNPKIPLNFVIDHGELLYTDQKKLDLRGASAIRRTRAKESADRKEAKAKAAGKLAENDKAADDNPVDVVKRRKKQK